MRAGQIGGTMFMKGVVTLAASMSVACLLHGGLRPSPAAAQPAPKQEPGHTPGVLSAEFTVFDNGTPHKALWQGGGGFRGGLAEAEEAVATTNRIAQMPGIEVLVQIHSWAAPNGYPGGGVLERAQLLAKRKPGDPHPFVDPAAWRQFIERAQVSAARNVAQEKQKAATAR
jgi:metallo-beta-lactamase class B